MPPAYGATKRRRDDVEGGYAGLRPLVGGNASATTKLSREHVVAQPAPGLIVVAGGKYTTYRVMAKVETYLARVEAELDSQHQPDDQSASSARLAAGDIDADLVLMADSDVVFVRPTTADRFQVGGRRWLYREEGGVTADMERHVIWHRVARELFGLPPAPPPPLPDYVSPLNAWEPGVVRAMQRHIERVTGRNWLDVFCGQLHISEFILYGVFVDEVMHASGPAPQSDTSVCLNSWERTPLTMQDAYALADQLKPETVAMMISAKSNTPVDVRRAAIERCAEIVKTR